MARPIPYTGTTELLCQTSCNHAEESTYVVEEVIADKRKSVRYRRKIVFETHQEKSQVFIHFAFWHLAFVHGKPYAKGLKYV